jgi:acyl-[acyl-carrier-protein]-phospholipid O-acyltransferase/long-chain-fatty-acid--[acyl-carrier-protein] ligase
MIGTPTFLMGYAKSAHHFDFNSVRLVISGGEKLKDEVKYAWLEKFGIKILEGYGTTEASPVLSVNTPLYNSTGSVGKILPGIEWRLEKVDGIENGGNLMVKGENIMEGYLLADKGFMPTPEWYNTGDIVEVSKDGFVTIKSRLKRFAKISGEMISLDAVEKIAENCFCNAQFAAVSKAHPKKGEMVVLYSTDPTVSKSSIREYLLKTGESMIMLPNEVVYIEKIPLLGSGKFDYVTLSKAA